jgi:hypothetical protein
MAAFNFNLCNSENWCFSDTYIVCIYHNGTFNFNGFQIPVGNSLQNDSGGMGGFVGPNHEYFVYCGSKYAEIAIVKLNDETKEWEHHVCLQWDNLKADENGFFTDIWFMQEELALIFEPRTMYRDVLMKHKDLAGGTYCIKVDLSTGAFAGLTRKQLVKQRRSVLDEYSKWPHLNDQSFDDSSSENTLIETSRPVPTKEAVMLDIIEDTMAKLSGYLDEALRKFTIVLNG